jgi:hypothetical protein
MDSFFIWSPINDAFINWLPADCENRFAARKAQATQELDSGEPTLRRRNSAVAKKIRDYEGALLKIMRTGLLMLQEMLLFPISTICNTIIGHHCTMPNFCAD